MYFVTTGIRFQQCIRRLWLERIGDKLLARLSNEDLYVYLVALDYMLVLHKTLVTHNL